MTKKEKTAFFHALPSEKELGVKKQLRIEYLAGLEKVIAQTSVKPSAEGQPACQKFASHS